MTVQKYKCWLEGDSEKDAETLQAPDPETAAEWLCESIYDSCVPDYEVNVQDEDGTVYGVFVEVELRPRFQGRKN